MRSPPTATPPSMRLPLERFQAKWKPVRVKKTRQIKNPGPRFDSIETERALALCGLHHEFGRAVRNPGLLDRAWILRDRGWC
jgi:hypothetical protein